MVWFFLAITGADDLDDTALAHRIKQGDARAFRAFFNRYHGLLYGYLRRRGLANAACEDLIQHAFLTIWERRHEIDADQSIRALLFKIGYTRALNLFRDTAKFTDASVLQDQVASAAPDRDADFALLRQSLLTAVAALPERRRAVFELCFLQEFTYREAAEMLGISPKTVEHQMGHALKAIRHALRGFIQTP